MEAHPVPQNIIDVEFKLFGSFTLKQFGKILIGSLLALGIFITSLPDLIKFPLCFISIIIGIGMAIIPNLGVWINGFLRAIFFSPRYVWIKDTFTPEILQNKVRSKAKNDIKISSSHGKKLEITDLPLDKLFGTRTSLKTKNQNTDDTGDKNFVRVYDDVFKDDVSSNKVLLEEQSDNKTSSISENQSIFSKTNQPLIPSEKKFLIEKPTKRRFKTIEEYNEQLKKLKFQLSMLSKDNEYKMKEEEILSEINELYQEVKVLTAMVQPSKEEVKTNASLFKNPKISQQDSQQLGRIIFGIIVDKNDNPISQVNISFINSETKMIYRTTSSNDGKFSSTSLLPFATYTIALEDTKHKFHSYTIEVKNQKLPAYKFREK